MISGRQLCVHHRQIFQMATRCISTTEAVCGRRQTARLEWLKIPGHPYDSRFPISPKVVAETSKHSGKTKELLEELGRTGEMMPQMPGFFDKEGKFHYVKEMVPEFVVPDLKDCDLKPYVPYNAPKVTQSPLTAKDLFNEIYAKDIVEQYKSGKLDLETLTPEKILSKGGS